jgi:hypothetical protein
MMLSAKAGEAGVRITLFGDLNIERDGEVTRDYRTCNDSYTVYQGATGSIALLTIY